MGLIARPAILVSLLLLAPASAAAAELYKWIDEKGVTNYSNTPPARTPDGKPATIVEDRLSVYTPEEPVTQALERAKARHAQPTSPPQSPGRVPEPDRRAAPPPPPPAAYDPCLNPDNPNCRALLYDSSPVFQGRRRPVPLTQPQPPAGTIAGTATASGSYVPGQSGTVPSARPADTRLPARSGNRGGDEPGGGPARR